MASQLECRFFHRLMSIDDVTNEPHCKNLKFKRAFQFLQLLLIQRVYGIDIITSSPLIQSPTKHSQRQAEIRHQRQQQQQNYQVFLGGSCNPTTWRRDHAIPYFQRRSVSFYNPQVADWSPELVEIEHRAKELAPLLFFVIDYDTRALAAIIEVCYLAARGRRIIVVINPMPEKESTKFIVQKSTSLDSDDNKFDYDNVCEARRILRLLLQSINIPVFDNVRLALECAATILEKTKQTVSRHSIFIEDTEEDNDDQDVLTQLPMSPSDCHNVRGTSVVYIRSLSNKTAFRSPDEFYKQLNRNEMTSSSPIDCPVENNSISEPTNLQFQAAPVDTKQQISCSTNESDNDDGYGSLASSNRTLSISTTSLSSESFESVNDPPREDNSSEYSNLFPSTSMINNILSTFYSYVPFIGSNKPDESTNTQSLFVLFTLPFRFIKNTFSSALSTTVAPLPSIQEPLDLTSSLSSVCSLQSTSDFMFDLYIASGDYDECWLNTFAIPTLKKHNISYTKRQSSFDNDQYDVLCDVHVRKQSRILFYLINGHERLSYLLSELAFLIGERKHEIFVYLQMEIDDDCETIVSQCERRDLLRSRKYFEDLARKENIRLSYSRDQSWQQVLDFIHQNDQIHSCEGV